MYIRLLKAEIVEPMKKLRLLLPALFLVSFGFAKNFETVHDSSYSEGSASIDKDIYSDISTQSSENVSLVWKVTSWDAPDEWNLALCDNKTCIYDPVINEAHEMALFTKDDDVFFKGTFSPNNTSGTGILKIWVYEAGNETEGEEVIMVYNTWSLGFADNEAEVSFNVYPNPAQNFLKITFSQQVDASVNVKIFNLLGQDQENITVTQDRNNVRIDISALKNGNYLLQFTDQKGELQTHRFTKRF